MAEGWGHPINERVRERTNGYHTREWFRSKWHNPPANPAVCRHYMRGTCIYGDKCRFSHSDVINNGNDVKIDKTDTGINPKCRTPPPTPESQNSSDGDKASGDSALPDDWVNAPEFVPSTDWNLHKSPKTYAEVAGAIAPDETEASKPLDTAQSKRQEEAEYGAYCPFTHPLICDICHVFRLHPSDEDERKKHITECIKKHEREMEISFAIQRSKDKTCGICYEVVKEKAIWDQKFGILPNCNHCFCLTCIRKWRQVKNFDNKIIRACPECRVASDFVCPSKYWVDNKEEKEKLILDYKGALSSKDCKYFLQGRGKCPFGNKCFYLHAYPDGTKADVGPPVRQRRQNADGETSVFQHIFLWDFLEERENLWHYALEDLDDIFAFFSESDDSDWSDYDIFL